MLYIKNEDLDGFYILDEDTGEIIGGGKFEECENIIESEKKLKAVKNER